MPASPRSSDPPTQPGATRLAALPLALAAATGVATASLVAFRAGGPSVTLSAPTPPSTELGVGWSPSAVGPDAVLAGAVEGLGATVGGLGAMTFLVALAAAATLLAAAGSLRRRELAVRGALGSGPVGLAIGLVRRDGPVLLVGLLAGWVAGLLGSAALHGSWPGPGSADALLAAASGIAPGMVAVGAVCLCVALVLTLGPVRFGVGRLASSLAAGARATADPREGGVRRVATVLQTAASLALLSASLVIWSALPGPRGEERSAAGDLLLLPAVSTGGAVSAVERAARYRELLDRLGALPTVASESIASPGAWTGVATSDLVLADCGNCIRGLMWVPFLGEEAVHHAVSPGFFASAGMELVAGRDFTRADGLGAEPVAIVSEPMARRNFEDGDPLGRRIRVGEGMESWYTVVGVVREGRGPGLGLPDRPSPAVYLSLLQHPPDRVELGFRVAPGTGRTPVAPGEDGPPAPAQAVRMAALAVDLEVPSEARSLAELRGRQTRPLHWAAAWAALLGLVALTSAALGVHRVATVEVAARRRELGIRLALGATGTGLTRWVLGRTARSTLLGALLAVPLAVAITARLRESTGDVPLFDPVAFSLLGAVLLGTALAGAWRPARSAARTEPARVIAEE